MAPNRRLTLIALAASALLTACGGGSSSSVPEETRPQDGRTFSTASIPAFTAMTPAQGDTVDVTATSRWSGVLGGAAYRVEVPANWNGKLVMYAHGYAGEGSALTISNPSIRRHLIEQGYAWAASSYSKNYYDVRAGVDECLSRGAGLVADHGAYAIVRSPGGLPFSTGRCRSR